MSTAFRKLLEERTPAVLAGAHSGISAKIVEECSFDGIWASSFEISSLFGVPDANLLSFKEIYDIVSSIRSATALPIIVDCDNGYGGPMNVIRTVKDYEALGIEGVCIEDNLFPKRCSFYESNNRGLEDARVFAKKIVAAKEAQCDPNFFVIARTEALIAGLSMEEALRRARMYDDAGADAILVHSKKTTADEVREFAGLWDSKTPLVVVPTKFLSVSCKELGDMGFRIVIFANHGLRASINGMRKSLAKLRETGMQESISDGICPLEDVFKLVGLADFLQKEERYS